MNYYFYLTMFTIRQLGAITVILGVIVLVLCGVGHFLFVCFLQNNKHSSNKLFLEDLAAPRRAYKNYQLWLIC